MLITNSPPTIFASVAKAEAVVASILAGGPDPEAIYVVVPDPAGSGRAIIEVREADGGELILKL